MKRLSKGKKLCALLFALLLSLSLTVTAFAAETDAPGENTAAVEEAGGALGLKAVASGIAVGLAAAGGAVGMGMVVAKSAESIARQPEAESKIRTTMMLGLVFIETAIIYALLVVVLIIFVL